MNSKLVNVALWSVAVLVAAGAGTAAVAASATPTGRPVLSQQDVDRQLGTTPDLSPAPALTQAGAQPATGTKSQALFASAGTIVVQCDGSQVTLLRWAPATGFHAEDTVAGTGPAGSVTVKFESDTAEVRVSAICVNGTAVLSTDVDKDHQGDGGPTTGPTTSTPNPTPTETGDDHGKGHGGGGHGDGNNNDG